MRRTLLLGLTAAALAPAGAAAQCATAGESCIDTLALRAHTRFLADDALLGRGAGTRGERIAALYIAAQLQRLGLDPLGDDFLLPVPLVAARVLPETRLTLHRTSDALVFRHGEDFLVNTGAGSAFRDFSGPAVFVGSPANALASLEATHVDGRVVVVTGTLGAAATRLVPAWRDAGAVGILLLVPDAGQFDLFARSRGPDRFFVDAVVQDAVWQPELPVLIAGPSLVRALLDGATLPAAAREDRPFHPVSLERTVAATIAVERRDVPAANVAAVVTGADPALRDELVLFTAHLDHLGISTPDATGDSIYNGFSDNAAGVAMVLAIARALRDDPPRRSVGFLFLTGEERGLLGASHYASHPATPLARVAAVINLDAGAPPAPPASWRIAGGSASTAGEVAVEVAERHGWSADLGDASPNSDYWPFLARGVPALFVIPGPTWEGVSESEQEELRRRWDRYHQPGDHYDPLFPFAGLRRYAGFALEIGLAIANGDARPRITH